MLDIQGQQPVAATPATPPPPASSKPSGSFGIPSISGGATRITEITTAAVVALVIIAGAYLSFVLATKQSLVATETRELNQVKEQLGTPERVKTEALVNQYKTGSAAVQTALATASPWSALLKDLTVRVPTEVTLNNLSTADGLTIRLSGSATSYQDLAQFITALTSTPLFTSVSLESATLSDAATGASVSFTLKATYVPAKPVATTAQSTNQGTNGTR